MKIPDDLTAALIKKILFHRCFWYILLETSFYKKPVKIYFKNGKTGWWTWQKLQTVKRNMLVDIKLNLIRYLYPDHYYSNQQLLVKNIFSVKIGSCFLTFLVSPKFWETLEERFLDLLSDQLLHDGGRYYIETSPSKQINGLVSIW